MAKIIKKKTKRRIRLEGIAAGFFVFACLLCMSSSLFLRSYNIALTKDVQNMETEIKTLKTENEAIKVAVQNLSTRDRVYDIAQQDGLAAHQDNISTIAGSGE